VARCGGVFNNHFTANLPKNLLVKNRKSVKTSHNYGHEFVASLFWPTLCVNNKTSELHQIFDNVAVARFSSGGVAVCYILPVSWTTTCFHIMGPI